MNAKMYFRQLRNVKKKTEQKKKDLFFHSKQKTKYIRKKIEQKKIDLFFFLEQKKKYQKKNRTRCHHHGGQIEQNNFIGT